MKFLPLVTPQINFVNRFKDFVLKFIPSTWTAEKDEKDKDVEKEVELHSQFGSTTCLPGSGSEGDFGSNSDDNV